MSSIPSNQQAYERLFSNFKIFITNLSYEDENNKKNIHTLEIAKVKFKINRKNKIGITI